MTARTSTENPPEKLEASVEEGFSARHVGLGAGDVEAMVEAVGYSKLEDLIDAAVPSDIRLEADLNLPEGLGEREALEELREIMGRNQVLRSFIGAGYYDCITPAVIQRCLLENPGWYTAYTPYQAEIAQGRLEALLNFQTMVTDLTGMDVANASLLDEGTAAAEAMAMCAAVLPKRGSFFVSRRCHPQTIDVVQTRAEPLGIEVLVGDHEKLSFEEQDDLFGVLGQYPATDGEVIDYGGFAERAKEAGVLVVVAADLLALTLLKPPGEFGADLVVGSAQRFGVPLGYGGPHAGYIATVDKHKRRLPGRLVGVSKDAQGKKAFRLSLQTREQHIRRDKATSNICTAQALLAVMAAMYASYHGPDGLRRMARRVHRLTSFLAAKLRAAGCEICSEAFFDTIEVCPDDGGARMLRATAEKGGINLRYFREDRVGISLDETTSARDVVDLLLVFGISGVSEADVEAGAIENAIPASCGACERISCT